VGISGLKWIAHSRERDEMLRYLDQHDGKYRRYQYFTRPMIVWISGTPAEKMRSYEYRPK
jgi:hypothetical protein